MTKTAKRWAKIVAEWKGSGLKAIDFARSHDLNVGTLRWWARRLVQIEQRSSASFIQLTPIATEPPVSAPVAELRPVEVLLRSGHTVRVYSPSQSDTLRSVLAALETVP